MASDAVNIHEAKTQLSKLVERAAAGSEVVIAKYGPLDVPAQMHKRGKRHSVDLVCHAATGTRPFIASVVKRSVYTTELPNPLSFIAPHSGRAPPFQS